jgi:hypothetical protein
MFHVEQTTENFPHNLVIRVEPRLVYAPIAELWKDDTERALAENAMWFFITNPQWSMKDRTHVSNLHLKYGHNMFLWKYYAAARCYLGGYKALSATLVLRKLR